VADPLRVVSFGGGVNSTAMLLLLERQQRLPHVSIFADTGGERPETYEHVASMARWCEARGVYFVTVRNEPASGDKTLEANCLRRKELPSLAYGFKGCSVKWKRQPLDRYLREYPGAVATWARGQLVERYIGIDAGETSRAKLPPDKLYSYHYPLNEAGWGRDECVAAIKDAGLAVPPKSSCFFCPAMRKSEILQLQADHPDLLARALAIEANAVTDSVAGLGRNWRWRDLIETDRRQGKLFAPASPCDCMDGDDDREADRE
jgi:Phosphoadenosine phosphosulfate reductase family